MTPTEQAVDRVKALVEELRIGADDWGDDQLMDRAADALTALQARVGELEALVNEQADALEEVGDGTCGINCEAEGSYDHADLIAKARALLTPPAPHSDGER